MAIGDKWDDSGKWIGGIGHYPDYENRKSQKIEDAIAVMHERERSERHLVYGDGSFNQYSGIGGEIHEQVWLDCGNCGKPMLVEFHYMQGRRPIVFKHGSWCYKCQREMMVKQADITNVVAGHEAAAARMIEKELEIGMKETRMRGDEGAKVQNRGQVTEQVNRLEEKSKFLQEVTEQLSDRLTPVLGDYAARDAIEDAKAEELCLVATAIRDRNDELDNVGEMLTTLIERLEI